MANSIDQLNYYDPLVRNNSNKMSEEWISQISSLIDVLTEYLQPYGIFAPQLTTDERNTIQSPVNGQIIYNTTLNKAQIFEAGAWVNLV